MNPPISLVRKSLRTEITNDVWTYCRWLVEDHFNMRAQWLTVFGRHPFCSLSYSRLITGKFAPFFPIIHTYKVFSVPANIIKLCTHFYRQEHVLTKLKLIFIEPIISITLTWKINLKQNLKCVCKIFVWNACTFNI